jgi:hypothetical protein
MGEDPVTTRPAVVRVIGGVVLIGLAAGGAGAADVAAVPSGTGGMRAYADPRTGALRERPLPGEAKAPPTAAFSRSAVGLVETPAPGGGIMLDLQGRFRSPLVATVAPDGTVRIDHETPDE